MSKIKIIRVHSGDLLARQSINTIMNPGHDGRVRQSILSFYREGFRNFLDKTTGDVLFLLALLDSSPVGMSSCQIIYNRKRNYKSTTIVNPEYRRLGAGKMLLETKIEMLKVFFPTIQHLSFVSKENESAVMMCKSSGLKIVDEGKRNREDKEPTSYFVMSK